MPDEQGADPAEPGEMAHTHGFAPLRLADRDQGRPVVIVETESNDVQCVAGLVGRVVDGARADTVGVVAEALGRCQMPGPVAADVFEVRAQDIADEPALAALAALP